MDSFLEKIKKEYLKMQAQVDYQTFVYSEKYFTPEECEKIITLGKKLALKDASVGTPKSLAVDKTKRTSRVGFLSYSPETQWIFEKVEYLLRGWNKKIYNFKLVGFSGGLQFTEYNPGGHYVWHQDFGRGVHSRRKLSITVQLSDPQEYKGGDLELSSAPGAEIPTSRGTAIVFPSFEQHRVTAVTKGMRYSLVGWIEGPPFR